MRRFNKLRYVPDLILGLSFSLLLVTEITRLLSSMTTDPNQALIYFKIVNAVLMPAIALWFLAFTFYYQGELSILSLIVIYLTGLLGGGFIFSTEISVTFDTVTQNWNGVYPTLFFLLIAPLILIAFLRIIQPLLRRIKYLQDRTDQLTLVIMSFGIGLVLLWGISSAFTTVDVIRMFRPLFLASGWLIWYLTSRRNPFFLSASHSNPQRLFITSTSGQLYYSHSFGEDEGTASELLAPLVSAVNNMALEVLQADSGVKSFNIGNREVVTVTDEHYYYHLVGTNLDDVIKGVFTQFARDVQSQVKQAKTGEYMNLGDEVEQYFNQLIIIEDQAGDILELSEDVVRSNLDSI